MNYKLLKSLVNSHDHLGFLEALDGHEKVEQLYEELCACFLKATLPGETYHFAEDVVPDHIAIKYEFSHLIAGGRTKGMDIININDVDGAVAYECRWLYNDSKTIRENKVTGKIYHTNKTKISRTIFCTNAREPSKEVKKDVPEAGFLLQDHWYSKEVYEVVKHYLNTRQKKTYQPMQPRDQFFVDALDELKHDVLNHKKVKKKKLHKVLCRILQHWPASSGKGSFPRLAYDRIFEPLWDYKKGFPINLVLSPNLVVAKTNLKKLIDHDRGLMARVLHIVYTASDIRNAASTTEELQALRSDALVITDRKELIDIILTANCPIFIHTIPHNYKSLAELMRAAKKQFYFAHIDEVHHLIQADFSSWTLPLNDKACKINFRLMTTANKRHAYNEDGTESDYDMFSPNFADIQVKLLTEKMAVEFGYKRQTVPYIYNYDPKDEWLELIEFGVQPLYRLKDSDIVAPLSWHLNVDALIRFRVENSHYNHTKITLNTIEDCVKFGEFLREALPKYLEKYAPSGIKDAIRKRLLNAEIMVADTKSNSTIRLLKQVNSIPHFHKDSFVIHCRLLGEGWDPENGWIDSNIFVDPVHSKIRIYQDVNRGARIGNGKKTENAVVIAFLGKGAEHYNAMFEQISYICEILEIGLDDIWDEVKFHSCKYLPKTKKTIDREVGSSYPVDYDELDAEDISRQFQYYVKHGIYRGYGSLIDNMTEEYLTELVSRGIFTNDYFNGNETIREQLLCYEIINKNKQFFEQYSNKNWKFKFDQIKQAKDFRNSASTIVKASQTYITLRNEASKRKAELTKLLAHSSFDDNSLTTEYIKLYNPKVIEPVYITDNNFYCPKTMKYIGNAWQLKLKVKDFVK